MSKLFYGKGPMGSRKPPADPKAQAEIADLQRRIKKQEENVKMKKDSLKTSLKETREKSDQLQKDLIALVEELKKDPNCSVEILQRLEARIDDAKLQLDEQTEALKQAAKRELAEPEKCLEDTKRQLKEVLSDFEGEASDEEEDDLEGEADKEEKKEDADDVEEPMDFEQFMEFTA